MPEQKSASANQAAVVSNEKPRRGLRLNRKTSLLLVGILLVLGVILVVRLLAVNAKFKTITYRNGQGQTFTLKFYNSHYLSKDFTTNNPTQALHQNDPGYKYSSYGLASGVKVANQPPLWLAISASSLSQEQQLQTKKDKKIACQNSQTVITVNNTHIGQKIPVCNTGLLGRPTYSASFAYKQKLYFVVITQIASNSDITNQGKSNTGGLSSYTSDISTIVGSIQPQ